MRSLLGIFFACVSCLTLSAQSASRLSPQVISALQQPAPQEKVADCLDTQRDVLWNNNVVLRSTAEGLTVSGRGARSRAWNTIVPISGVMQCEIWSAALAKGQAKSLLILVGDEMGGTYGASLTILSFDQENMPIPWQARGSFTSTKTGIAQIVRNTIAGGTQILVSHRQGDRHDGYAYITSLYNATDIGLAKFIGKDGGGNQWPFLSGNLSALTGNESKATRSINYGREGAPSKRLSISQVLGYDQPQPILYSDGSKTRYPAIVEMNRLNGSRTIYFDENVPDGVAEAKRSDAKVALKGTACDGEECGPFLLVAEAGRTITTP